MDQIIQTIESMNPADVAVGVGVGVGVSPPHAVNTTADITARETFDNLNIYKPLYEICRTKGDYSPLVIIIPYTK